MVVASNLFCKQDHQHFELFVMSQNANLHLSGLSSAGYTGPMAPSIIIMHHVWAAITFDLHRMMFFGMKKLYERIEIEVLQSNQ